MNIEELARYLTFLKIRAGKTYDEMEAASNVPKSTISRLFKAQTQNPSMDAVARLLQALDGSMAEFESGEWKKEPVSIASGIEGKTVSMEAHLTMLDVYERRLSEKDAYIAKRLQEKDAEVEQRLAEKDAERRHEVETIERHKSEQIESLKKDKKVLSIALIIETVFIIGLFVVDIMNPAVGWARYQVALMKDGISNVFNRWRA